jgi:transketolase
MIVAHTIKGHGVSFMEGVIEYHGSTLSEDEVKRALAELEGAE